LPLFYPQLSDFLLLNKSLSLLRISSSIKILSLKTYSKNSNHLIKIFELYSFVICVLLNRLFSLSICSSFSFKNLFIAFYLASLKKSLPPHAYLYMRKG